jgi:hypothetical protein
MHANCMAMPTVNLHGVVHSSLPNHSISREQPSGKGLVRLPGPISRPWLLKSRR